MEGSLRTKCADLSLTKKKENVKKRNVKNNIRNVNVFMHCIKIFLVLDPHGSSGKEKAIIISGKIHVQPVTFLVFLFSPFVFAKYQGMAH